jgi:putative transcriptional regulator
MQLASGMLLVATPALQDPNFADTVVLLLDVTEEGALGVVLNRPSQILVADVLEPWRDVVAHPEVLFRGGPVGTDGALAVGALRDPQDPPVGWRPVAGLLGMVDLDTPTEVEEGSWYVVSSEAADAFRDDPSGLWRDVMRRQPGMLAWHVNRPVDPDLN